MNNFYRKKLIGIFGALALEGDRKLLWIGPKCLVSSKSHRHMANYMKNPILSLFEKIEFMYIKAEALVLVRKSEGDHDDGVVKRKGSYHIPFVEFAERFILEVLRGFNGKRFPPSGAFHGNNTFNKVLKLAVEYPDAINVPDWHSSESILPEEMFGDMLWSHEFE